MLTYKDMTFCSDKCENYKCERNMKIIKNTSGLYISIASFKDSCVHYIKPKDRREKIESKSKTK